MTDPNLDKFLEVHRKEIKRGYKTRVLNYARDYLSQIASPERAAEEFREFQHRVNSLTPKKSS